MGARSHLHVHTTVRLLIRSNQANLITATLPHLAPTRLYLYRGWWSAHAPPAAPLTVFTMASLDRLALLEAQCRSFAGPHVAAVYLPLRVAAEGPTVDEEGFWETKAAERVAAEAAAAAAEEGEVQEDRGEDEEKLGRRRARVRGKGLKAMSAGSGGGGEGGVIPGHEMLGWLSEAHQGQIKEGERRLQVGVTWPVALCSGRS